MAGGNKKQYDSFRRLWLSNVLKFSFGFKKGNSFFKVMTKDIRRIFVKDSKCKICIINGNKPVSGCKTIFLIDSSDQEILRHLNHHFTLIPIQKIDSNVEINLVQNFNDIESDYESDDYEEREENRGLSQSQITRIGSLYVKSNDHYIKFLINPLRKIMLDQGKCKLCLNLNVPDGCKSNIKYVTKIQVVKHLEKHVRLYDKKELEKNTKILNGNNLSELGIGYVD